MARGDGRIRLALVQVSPSGKHRHPAARHRPVPRRPVQQPLPVHPRIQTHRSNLPAAARDYRDGHAVLMATTAGCPCGTHKWQWQYVGSASVLFFGSCTHGCVRRGPGGCAPRARRELAAAQVGPGIGEGGDLCLPARIVVVVEVCAPRRTLCLAQSPGSQRARVGIEAVMSPEPRTLSRRSLPAASLPGAAVKTMMRRSAPCTDSTSQSSSSSPRAG